jgi:pilus assembly protein CpaF
MSREGNIYKSVIEQYLSPIKSYLEDPSVSEILINSFKDIFVERFGKLERVLDANFPDDDSVRTAVNSIAQSVGRRIDNEEPRLDARLPDGSRIAAVIPPCSQFTVVSIRKFTQSSITFKQYVEMGAVTADAAVFLDVCMVLGKNVLVGGGTGSGKTTLLSLLCSRIPKGQRIITIEDAKELNINYDHVVSFETRQMDAYGKGEVSMKDLLKSSLRLRPDRIIVGEVRSSEAIELVNAMNTGHKGCLGTVHANTPDDAIIRLEALAQSSDVQISERALRAQISSAIDIILQVNRFSDGSRRVASISEVNGFHEDGSYKVVPIFEMSRMVRGADGKLSGALEPKNIPSFMQEILDNKLPFPQSKFKTQAA